MDTATITTEIILLGIAFYLLLSVRPAYPIIVKPPPPVVDVTIPIQLEVVDTERKIFCKSFVSQLQPFDDDFMSFN